MKPDERVRTARDGSIPETEMPSDVSIGRDVNGVDPGTDAQRARAGQAPRGGDHADNGND